MTMEPILRVVVASFESMNQCMIKERTVYIMYCVVFLYIVCFCNNFYCIVIA
jgi:hypothetical protein